MNESEKAALIKLQEERDLARAMRWPHYDYPETIKPPAAGVSGHITGWSINADRAEDGSTSLAVSQAWTANSSHGEGPAPGIRGSMSNRCGIELYVSRLDALRALRLELTTRYAQVLKNVDDLIADEEATLEECR